MLELHSGHTLPPLGRDKFFHYLREKQTQTSKKKIFGNRINPEQVFIFNNHKDGTEAEGGEERYL